MKRIEECITHTYTLFKNISPTGQLRFGKLIRGFYREEKNRRQEIELIEAIHEVWSSKSKKEISRDDFLFLQKVEWEKISQLKRFIIYMVSNLDRSSLIALLENSSGCHKEFCMDVKASIDLAVMNNRWRELYIYIRQENFERAQSFLSFAKKMEQNQENFLLMKEVLKEIDPSVLNSALQKVSNNLKEPKLSGKEDSYRSLEQKEKLERKKELLKSFYKF